MAQIQFSDRVLIYQREGKNEDFKYHLKDKISQTFECSLLVMCMDNLILCHERKLQCLSFTGVRLREWILESHIRYIRSVGGKKGKEVLIAGLKNGQVSFSLFLPIQFVNSSLVSEMPYSSAFHRTAPYHFEQELFLQYVSQPCFSALWSLLFFLFLFL